ncbi:hypothetical protein BHM03_00019006 [Ensete ventricosum]|nr:hypothetical protein BHM03_00019006 [Ensete ventricosum]
MAKSSVRSVASLCGRMAKLRPRSFSSATRYDEARKPSMFPILFVISLFGGFLFVKDWQLFSFDSADEAEKWEKISIAGILTCAVLSIYNLSKGHHEHPEPPVVALVLFFTNDDVNLLLHKASRSWKESCDASTDELLNLVSQIAAFFGIIPFSLTLRKISVRDEFKAASGLKARVDQAFSVRASTATPEVVRREVSCGLCAFQPLKPRPRRIGLHVGASRGPLQLVVQPGLNLVGEVVERLERDIGLTEVYSGRHELGIIE